MKTRILTIALAGTVGATAAYADVDAMATTELNLRAGPGPDMEIIDVIPAKGEVDLTGCLEDSKWCTVSYDDKEGWAYGEYLAAGTQQDPKIVVRNREEIELDKVTYTSSGDAAATAQGATVGAIMGGVVGGPAGAAAGAAAGGALAGGAEISDNEVTYVRENRVEPVYLDGEVVVGAQLPEVVTLREVPQSDYTYAYVNNVPVLVEPEDRRVIRIVR